MDLSNSEDVAMEGPIIRIAMEGISISIIHMIHNQNNMALPAVYAVDLIIPPSIATRENMTYNIMEKLSINPHQSQQNNLYQ